MSIPRLLHIITLLLFIVFVSIFFTVLARLSRIGVSTERYANIVRSDAEEVNPVQTQLTLLGQDTKTGRLNFKVEGIFDVASDVFYALLEGDRILLRVENLRLESHGNINIYGTFSNPSNDRYVAVDFGEFFLDVHDKRDFYPFDGYEINFNFAYFSTGKWYVPREASVRSLTNLILLNPRYTIAASGVESFQFRVARLRIQQFLTATLILIEILFLIFLITMTNLDDLLRLGLGYLVGLYIIREILTAGAPQFPTIVDYGSMFLICVTFFLMLFRFLGKAEETTLITIPPIFRHNSHKDPVDNIDSNEDESDSET